MFCFNEDEPQPGSTPPPPPDSHTHQYQLPNHILLSELPEPPIPVSEIGPIPPPPMFSTPSPTLIAGRPHGPAVQSQYNSQGQQGQADYNDYDYDGKSVIFLMFVYFFINKFN